MISGLVIAQVLKCRSDCLPLKAIRNNGRGKEGSDQRCRHKEDSIAACLVKLNLGISELNCGP